ncbi:MAG: nitronate monooxygenase [Candidatus Pacebacteria bacterium]|nr:nitronate monooxygenase [Candidatus Paceibacterota bacterium]
MENKKVFCGLPPLSIGGRKVMVPIIQGGMGMGISLDRLSTAVAKSGGIGVISAIMCGANEEGFAKHPTEVSLEALKEYIKRAKENSGGVVGVNLMVVSNDYKRYIQVSIDAGADLLICGAGLPLDLPHLVETSDVGIAPIVSSGRAARIIMQHWEKKYSRYPDAIVVEGPKAGGHLGFKESQIFDPKFALEILVVDVLREIEPFEQRVGKKIPVIVAGGIYTGEDIFNFVRKGASGVQMGTRFVATHECDAAQPFKDAYVKARSEDVVIIKSPVGLPGRALKCSFLDEATAGKRRPKRCITKCIKSCKFPDTSNTPYCISLALINVQRGNLDHGFIFCGSNVDRVDKIVHVKELMKELVEGYQAAAA